MDQSHVNKLLQVWNSKNKILKPIDNKVLLDIVDNLASLFSPGNFFYMVFNFSSYELEFVSEGVKNVLGVMPKDFTFERLLEQMHPEDLAIMHKKETASLNFKLGEISKENISSYKTVYLMRFQTKNNGYRTILHQSKAISVSGDGKISRTIAVHTDVSHLNIQMDDKVSFVNEKGASYFTEDYGLTFHKLKSETTNLTGRELQILKEIVRGCKSSMIAEKLNLSVHTINTHKKNMLLKNNCNNTLELVTKFIREGVL